MHLENSMVKRNLSQALFRASVVGWDTRHEIGSQVSYSRILPFRERV